MSDVDFRTLQDAVALSYTNAGQSQEQKQRAIAYLDSISNSDDGWRFCLEQFFKPSDNELKFFCMTVFENLLQHK
jgi:hypothetical protein